MKAILRKGMAACAAVLMGANAMAQSFDFTKEFQGDVEDIFYSNGGGIVPASSFKDGNPRLVIAEEAEGNGENDDENGNYTYRNIVNKLSILDVNLNVEKEFTSGPLFEEYVNVTVKSAAKTLKVESVDTVYSGEEALEEFYRYFSVYINNDRYSYSDLVENYTEDEVRDYVKIWLEEERSYSDATLLGERFLFESYNVMESDYFEWGMQYPKGGWIYKDHNDVCMVRINYTPDELEEISRYNSSTYSACCNAEVYYTDFMVDMEVGEGSVIYSNGLFNDDEKYEFLLPELAVLESSSFSSYDGILTTRYNYEPIGYKVVSEDGTVLHRLMINEGKDNDVRCYAYLARFGEKNYLIVESYRVENSSYDEIWSDEVTCFYEIKKDGTGIQKVREMRGSMNIRPTVANREEQITITLNEENSNVARELVVTGVNGQLVDRRTIPAGENTVKMNAAMLRSGMYNFTLQKKGQVVDNGKVIVK